MAQNEETLGRRIRMSRERLQINQSELAAAVQTTTSAVSSWESDTHVPRKKTLSLVADVLKVSYSWLITGEESSERRAYEDGEIHYVPLVEWSQLSRIDQLLKLGFAEISVHRVATTVTVGRRSFALRMIGDVMGSELPESYVTIIDPDVKPKHKSYVLVCPDPEASFTFRKYTMDSGRAVLRSANKEIAREVVKKTTKIIGVVRECKKEFD